MSYVRPRQRLDDNHSEILAALQRVTNAVSLAAVGGGCADLLAKHRDGHLVLIELKSPDGRISPSQRRFAERWPVIVVRTSDEAIQAVGI